MGVVALHATQGELDVRHAREAAGDAGMSRWLVVIAGAAVFVMSARAPATAASPELCRQFHRECTEARAAGYRDVGICHVERLECPTDEDARVPNASYETRGEDRQDPEASWGERSIGP